MYHKLALIIAAAVTLILITLFFAPMNTEYHTVFKDEITTLKPFSGIVGSECDTYQLTTKIVCDYWLSETDVADVQTYVVDYSIFGMVTNVEAL